MMQRLWRPAEVLLPSESESRRRILLGNELGLARSDLPSTLEARFVSQIPRSYKKAQSEG